MWNAVSVISSLSCQGSQDVKTVKMSSCQGSQAVKSSISFLGHQCSPQSTEVFYLNDGEQEIGPVEKVYVTTPVTPMGLASSFNGIILKIIAKK